MIPMSKDDITEDTVYCYDYNPDDKTRNVCSHWERIDNHDKDYEGPMFYCSFVEKVDNISLGDQVKICGVGKPNYDTS